MPTDAPASDLNPDIVEMVNSIAEKIKKERSLGFTAADRRTLKSIDIRLELLLEVMAKLVQELGSLRVATKTVVSFEQEIGESNENSD